MLNTGTLIESKNKSVLNYFSKVVIDRYCKDHNKPIVFGKEVFQAYLKFIYISDFLNKNEIPAYMLTEILEIDMMWHTHLLFTVEYQRFCHQFFGRFIHHTPFSEDSLPPEKEAKKEGIRQFVTAIYQEFGKETVIECFTEKKFAQKGEQE